MLDLDYSDPAELMQFWARHQRGRGYRDLFPQGGKGSKRAVADLANYASNKATAMQCRLRGEVERAFVYEHICGRIYADLPSFAKF